MIALRALLIASRFYKKRKTMAKYADLEDMPIEDWLAGLVPLDITEGAVNDILFERGIEPGTTLDETTKKQRDLCKADLYMWCSLQPSITPSVKDADGGWSHSEGGQHMTVGDKTALRNAALRIYRLYGEKQGASTIRVSSFGMRMFGK